MIEVVPVNIDYDPLVPLHGTTPYHMLATNSLVQWKMSLKGEAYFQGEVSLKALILGSSEDDLEVTQPATPDGGGDPCISVRHSQL